MAGERVVGARLRWHSEPEGWSRALTRESCKNASATRRGQPVRTAPDARSGERPVVEIVHGYTRVILDLDPSEGSPSSSDCCWTVSAAAHVIVSGPAPS